MKRSILFIIAALLISTGLYAQDNFRAQQRQQEKAIKAAYRSHKVTYREYEKLMNEQESIKYAIEKYDYEGVWTPHQKGVVYDKLERAHDRIRRYKTNWER